jgi:1,4-dihydroxy-6-naphthoate synthase
MTRPDPHGHGTEEVSRLSLGFSPCPNDTFIFHALVHGRVAVAGVELDVMLEDVETLNQLALAAKPDVTKVSYGVLPLLLDEYVLLRSGGALGRGCGPLIVGRPGMRLENLRRARIAIPGRHTTANLLLRLFQPAVPPGTEMEYSRIMPAVAAGEADAGLLIHESRFTYSEHGLECLVDLGEWWEEETGSPIPLGGIVARRSLGPLIPLLEDAIRRSVVHAFENPGDSSEYVRAHAQEMDPEVSRQHIALYVNDYSIDLGVDGQAAVEELLARARLLADGSPIQNP